jgi:Transposase
MTYPLKFRQKVFATKEQFKLIFEQASERFDIPMRTLFRWQLTMKPCTTPNKPATTLDMNALAKDVRSAPDDYQWVRAKRLGVTDRTVGYSLERLGVSHKKMLKHPKVNEGAPPPFKQR